MAVTYNGSSITTGTMYDSGNIKIKNGFSAGIEKTGHSNKNCDLVNSTIRDTVKKISVDYDNSTCACNKITDLKDSTIKTSIHVVEQSSLNELSSSVKNCVLKEATIRTSIIIP